ncbi:MAG: histidine kinase [endosymbiont of Galathealinum brachiosum]|uniref:Histidine kinase n=1 Tax=endosymbiont of Galathealinum brachiosum TaxID=2200906 RepID=A0A370DKG7_9GAMM|nr:MAG: histidine kinase [endosymbiont of Galathealinum brachiosum]
MIKPSIKTITLSRLLSFLLLAAVVMSVVIAFNFRMLSHNIVKNEATSIADIIKAGLTAHMKADVMDKRSFFLNEIKTVHDISEIEIIRAPAVNRQFGVSQLEKEAGEIVKKVFETKQPEFIIDDFGIIPSIRAVMPYIATNQGRLNCLDCHQVSEGTVLGAVDITLDITKYRSMASWLLMVLLVASLTIILLIAINTLRTVQVYIKDPLENLIVKAKDAYVTHEPVNSETFTTVEFENVAKEINHFNKDIIANQDMLKQLNFNLLELNNEIEDTLRETVFTMGVIEEQRSKEAKNHTRRVTEYSKLLATKLGLSNRDVELIASAAPLHDIGKLGIPDSILFKPGKLTTEEFETMQNHPAIGYSMLSHSKRDILKAAAIIAHQHHEKWNGSGYPWGLRQNDIHVYGRIVALADVYDALLSERHYKKAWPLDDVISWVEKESGSHFDPDLVDILISNIEEFVAIGVLYNSNNDGMDVEP